MIRYPADGPLKRPNLQKHRDHGFRTRCHARANARARGSTACCCAPQGPARRGRSYQRPRAQPGIEMRPVGTPSQCRICRMQDLADISPVRDASGGCRLPGFWQAKCLNDTPLEVLVRHASPQRNQLIPPPAPHAPSSPRCRGSRPAQYGICGCTFSSS